MITCKHCAAGLARTTKATSGLRNGYKLTQCATRREWWHVTPERNTGPHSATQADFFQTGTTADPAPILPLSPSYPWVTYD